MSNESVIENLFKGAVYLRSLVERSTFNVSTQELRTINANLDAVDNLLKQVSEAFQPAEEAETVDVDEVINGPDALKQLAEESEDAS